MSGAGSFYPRTRQTSLEKFWLVPGLFFVHARQRTKPNIKKVTYWFGAGFYYSRPANEKAEGNDERIKAVGLLL